MSERTAVYRLWDASDTLLYIGITENLDARFAGHESLKPWWPNVARKTIEWHDTRELAEAAETEAIRTEHALYNVAGSPWAPKPRELGANETLVGKAKARFGEIISAVEVQRTLMFLVGPTRNRAPVAAIVPAELGEAIQAAGGPDAALKKLTAPAT